MKIFAYEHITGGGCAGEPVRQALLAEAMLMLRALAGDLAAFTEVRTLCDARFEDECGDWAQCLVRNHSEWELCFDQLVRETDATWLVAPETGGVLERLSTRVVSRGKRLLGSAPHAVALAASKLATANALTDAGVLIVPTRDAARSKMAGPCVVKPDDGCGCEDTRRFAQAADAVAWIAAQPSPERFVTQPYMKGDPISLCVVASATHVCLLSVNRQLIELRDDAFCFRGCVVNAMADTGGKLASLAERTVAAIPGLHGYVGIDVLLTQDGPVVVEVNPRLTTSYAGLRSALGINPAELILKLMRNPTRYGLPPGRAVTVTVPVQPGRESAKDFNEYAI